MSTKKQILSETYNFLSNSFFGKMIKNLTRYINTKHICIENQQSNEKPIF